MLLVLKTQVCVLPQKLIDKLEGDLEYALRTDGKMAPADCENYAEVWGRGASCATHFFARIGWTHRRQKIAKFAIVGARLAGMPRTVRAAYCSRCSSNTNQLRCCKPTVQVRDEIKSTLEALRDTPVR